jgi:hypothetical protein
MEDGRIATQVPEWNSQGQRRCGRPVGTWKDGIQYNKHSRKAQGSRMFQSRALEEKIIMFLAWEKLCIP